MNTVLNSMPTRYKEIFFNVLFLNRELYGIKGQFPE